MRDKWTAYAMQRKVIHQKSFRRYLFSIKDYIEIDDNRRIIDVRNWNIFAGRWVERREAGEEGGGRWMWTRSSNIGELKSPSPRPRKLATSNHHILWRIQSRSYLNLKKYWIINLLPSQIPRCSRVARSSVSEAMNFPSLSWSSTCIALAVIPTISCSLFYKRKNLFLRYF